MALSTTRINSHAHARRARSGTLRGARLGVCVGALLALSTNAAVAAGLGNVATSIGVLGALAALFVIKGLPAHLPASTLSSAAAALLIAGGGVWLWRLRAVGRVVALGAGPGEAAELPDVVHAQPAAKILLPEGFEREALLIEMRRHFVLVQHAWDHAEMHMLRALINPDMLDELCIELPDPFEGVRANFTEVVTLRAELLGFESLSQVHVASVEFSGLIRESSEAGAVPFRELWLLTQSVHEPTVWRLARHQALI